MTVSRCDRREWLARASLLMAAGLVDAGAARQRALSVRDEGEAGLVVLDGATQVLRYRYATVPVPPALRARLSERDAESMRRYGHPRSNYIHPLYGLDGVPLTDDWSRDHPHHRGIYWAWPEVAYKGEIGDLHALQRVFARPTGAISSSSDDDGAVIRAENEWRWDDVTPIVREMATIRAYPRGPHGRAVDLTFAFAAIVDGVTIARRGTNAYGGLNTRLAPVDNLRLSHHADPPAAATRMAWQTAAGTWKGATTPASLTIFESTRNPGYPGDYIEFPDLPWFQPTFPAANTRHVLAREAPLVLRYRLWVAEGAPPAEDACRRQWREFQER